MALAGVDSFQTPLGDIPLDAGACKQLLALPQVQVMDAAHSQEHSLEVQLPFLQTVLNTFTLVPIVIGETTAAEVQQVLDLLWDGPQTLIVVSSDLSHYHDYNSAQTIDSKTCEAIEQLDIGSIDYPQACGSTAIQGLLLAAKRRKMTAHTLALANSGDSAGSRERVVGYGSWAFCNKDNSA
jgi:hypothetical protein